MLRKSRVTACFTVMVGHQYQQEWGEHSLQDEVQEPRPRTTCQHVYVVFSNRHGTSDSGVADCRQVCCKVGSSYAQATFKIRID